MTSALTALLAATFAVQVLAGIPPVSREEPNASKKPHGGEQARNSAPVLDQDIPRWKELKSKHGWKIKYPRNWTAWAVAYEDGGLRSPLIADPQAEPTAYIDGPNGCEWGKVRCAQIEIDSSVPQGADTSPSSMNGNRVADQHGQYNGPTKISLSGHSAHQAFSAFPRQGWPQKRPYRRITLKVGDAILTITYQEYGSDEPDIHSPSDWKYMETFDRMLSTFQLSEVDCARTICK